MQSSMPAPDDTSFKEVVSYITDYDPNYNNDMSLSSKDPTTDGCSSVISRSQVSNLESPSKIIASKAKHE